MPALETSIDFDVFETNNPRTLAIIDVSTYNLGDSFTNTTIKIKTPGYNIFTTVNFNQKKINVFNSNNLGFTSVSNTSELQNLPDGIYEITLQGDLNADSISITKNYLRVNSLLSKYEKVVLSTDLTCDIDKNLLNSLKEIELIIYGAIVSANKCNIGEATSLYKLASSKLDCLCQN